jgi:hypothetical protein
VIDHCLAHVYQLEDVFVVLWRLARTIAPEK